MNTLWKEIKFKMLHSGSKIGLLIGINIIVFIVINVPGVIEWLFTRNNLIGYYADEYLLLPAYLPKIPSRFWTPITYMFMHAGILHIFFNMLWLYWIGQIFEEYLGNKRTIGLYLLSGLSGALLFVLAYNFLPVFSAAVSRSVVVGASA
ncbi:MAG: rhomboid family intramembrane serine protease, partial [Mucilaginibacter sp.]